MSEKTCTTCGVTMAIAMFPRDPSRKDGYKYSCRTCTSERNRRWYQAKKAEGVIRSRAKAVVPWPVPTHSSREGLDSVRLRKWRGPVNHEPMRCRL